MAGSGQSIISQDYLPSGGTDYTPYIEKVIAEHPDAVYSTVITEDTVTLVKQGLPLGLFEKTNFFGIMDYGTIDYDGPAAGRRGGLHELPVGGDLPHAVLARARVAGQRPWPTAARRATRSTRSS